MARAGVARMCVPCARHARTGGGGGAHILFRRQLPSQKRISEPGSVQLDIDLEFFFTCVTKRKQRVDWSDRYRSCAEAPPLRRCLEPGPCWCTSGTGSEVFSSASDSNQVVHFFHTQWSAFMRSCAPCAGWRWWCYSCAAAQR